MAWTARWMMARGEHISCNLAGHAARFAIGPQRAPRPTRASAATRLLEDPPVARRDHQLRMRAVVRGQYADAGRLKLPAVLEGRDTAAKQGATSSRPPPSPAPRGAAARAVAVAASARPCRTPKSTLPRSMPADARLAARGFGGGARRAHLRHTRHGTQPTVHLGSDVVQAHRVVRHEIAPRRRRRDRRGLFTTVVVVEMFMSIVPRSHLPLRQVKGGRATANAGAPARDLCSAAKSPSPARA